jgi:hypothetical protein
LSTEEITVEVDIGCKLGYLKEADEKLDGQKEEKGSAIIEVTLL